MNEPAIRAAVLKCAKRPLGFLRLADKTCRYMKTEQLRDIERVMRMMIEDKTLHQSAKFNYSVPHEQKDVRSDGGETPRQDA